jgi:hypothetical protein
MTYIRGIHRRRWDYFVRNLLGADSGGYLMGLQTNGAARPIS